MKPQGGLSLLARLITALCCLSGLAPGALALRQGQARRRLLVSALQWERGIQGSPRLWKAGAAGSSRRGAGTVVWRADRRHAGYAKLRHVHLRPGKGQAAAGFALQARRQASSPVTRRRGRAAAAAPCSGCDRAGCGYAGCDRAATGCARRRRTGPRCTTREQWCHPPPQTTWVAI